MQVEAGKLTPLLTFPWCFRVLGVGGHKVEEFTALILESHHFSPPPALPSFLHELLDSIPADVPCQACAVPAISTQQVEDSLKRTWEPVTLIPKSSPDFLFQSEENPESLQDRLTLQFTSPTPM